MAEVVSASSLNDVHTKRGDGDSNEQDGQYYDKENPEAWKLAARIWKGKVSRVDEEGKCTHLC